MATKIRLARRGRKDLPHYAVIVADSRSPRDGRFIEKIGFYSPLKSKDDPKRLNINHERANFWLSKGAIPTDTMIDIFAKSASVNLPKKFITVIENKKKLTKKLQPKNTQEEAS